MFGTLAIRERKELADAHAPSEGLANTLEQQEVLRAREHVLPRLSGGVRGDLDGAEELGHALRLVYDEARRPLTDEPGGIGEGEIVGRLILEVDVLVVGKDVLHECRFTAWRGPVTETTGNQPALSFTKEESVRSIMFPISRNHPVK